MDVMETTTTSWQDFILAQDQIHTCLAQLPDLERVARQVTGPRGEHITVLHIIPQKKT